MKQILDAIDALSDEFESTFSSPGPGLLMNMFHENEQDLVEKLVRKHMRADHVTIEKDPAFKTDSYALWIIRYR